MIDRDVIQRVVPLLTRKFVFIAGIYILSLNVSSAPTGGNVVGGTGTINQSGLNTTINQNTQNLAVDWQSFDVNTNERVQFIQPNTSSIALNRILSNNGSTIQGQIDANGQVILVNPHGVFFSSTATVNVGGLIASTLDMTPSDFMNGNYIFNEVLGAEGAVINSGIINAALGGSNAGGNVALIGKQVKNDGLISANLGSVVLAAGKQSILTFDNQGLIGVTVTKEVLQSELGLEAAVTNNGEIKAEGGRVLLTASTSQDVFSQAVNNGALDQATSVVVNADGSFTLGGGADVVNTGSIDVSSQFNESNTARIVLVGENITSSGSIKADTVKGNAGEIEIHANDTTLLTQNSVTSAQALSSGLGGLVKVLGDKVGLTEFASINASGANGGGEILLGGDRQGLNLSVRNADFIYLGKNTNIKADAIENGDGGKIITFAKDTARIFGHLSARGGLYGGNGGFIETSGLRFLDVTKAPDTSAYLGNSGLWLIDPYNVVIQDADPADCGGADNCFSTAGSLFSPTGDTTYLTNSLLYSALLLGDVEINTGSSGSQLGDITFDGFLNYDDIGTTRTLTFKAQNDITFEANSIIGDSDNTNSDSLNINIYARGDVNVLSGAIINTHGGGLTVGIVDMAIPANTYLPTSFSSNAEYISTVGDVNEDSGDIKISTSGTLNTGILHSYAIEADRDLNGGNGLTGKSGGKIELIADGVITVDGLIDSTGGIADNDNNPAQTGGVGGEIIITSATDVLVNSNIISNGGQGDGDPSPATGGQAGPITINVGNEFNLNTGVTISAQGGPGKDGGPSGANNTITINGDASQNIFTINSGAILTGSTIAINGLGDNDQFRISENIAGTLYGGAGDDTFTFRDNQLSTTIVGGTESDTIVADTSNAQANTWTITGSNTGTLVNQGSLSGFSEIENLIGNTRTDTFTFNHATNSWIEGLISGGGGSSDSLDISILNSAVTVQLGNDFTSNPLLTTELNVDTVETITARANRNNTIKGENVNSTWSISSLGDGFVRPETGFNNENTVSFVDFYALTGNASIDAFTFTTNNNSWINGLVSGGTNTIGTEQDTLDIQPIRAQTVQLGTGAIADAVLNVDGFEEITADSNVSRQSTIIGNNADNAWTITALNSGTIAPISGAVGQNTVEFNNFSHLTGNTSIDQFTFNAAPSWINGLILGGNNTVTTENDTLDIRLLNGTTVQLGGITPTNGVLNVDQVESISANSAVVNSLLGDNVASDWLINDVNDGTVAPSASANDQNTVAFFDFNNLSGGDQADSFTIGSSGTIASIVGGAVDSTNATTRAATYNTLTSRTANTNWNIIANDSGTLTLTDAPNTLYVANFSSIQNLLGTTADDTFIFDGDFTIAGLIDGQNHSAGDAVDFRGISTARIFTIDDLAGYNNIEFYIGNDTNHTLQGDDGSNSWVIQSVNYQGVTDGKNDGILNGTIRFINFNTLIGGSADDTFSFIGNSSIENIDGGVTDLFDTNSYNTLIAKDTFNTWDITGVDAGELNKQTPTVYDVSGFTNIQNLSGSTDIDEFNFINPASWVNGLISGGNNPLPGDLDTLDIRTLVAVTVQLGNTTTTALNVDQVEDIRANATASPIEYNTLMGENIASDWLIDANNDGVVSPNLLADEQNTVIFNNFQQLVGGDQADIFTIALGGEIVDINGGLISGVSTYNTLIARDRDNTWHLTRNDGGWLEEAGAPTRYVENFDSIQNINGGSRDDEFIISDTVVMSGTVDGKDHISGDIVNVAAFQTDQTFIIGNTGFLNMEGFIGGNDGIGVDPNFTLEITNGNNVWSITGTNTGKLNPGVNEISFENFNNLSGGSGDDLFDFDPGSSITGLIIGGGEVQSVPFSQGIGDIIDMSKLNGALAVNVALATDITGVLGVERLIGNNNIGSTLTGANQNNTWNVTASNRGDVTSVDSLAGTMEFFDFHNLTGNLGRDDFTINDGFNLSGNINGVDSALNNSLTIQNTGITNTWTIDETNGGTASVALGGRFSNIDDLTGGAVNDVFNILDTFDITGDINGTGGTNTLSIATSSDNNWDIDGIDTGTTTVGLGGRFSNIANLIGGSRDDLFDFTATDSSISGLITGGGQNSRDIVDMSSVSGAINITLEGSNDITGIERVIANNNVATSITAENTNNTWTILTDNSGTVTSSTSSGGTIEFVNFPNLFGNQGQDNFTINDGATVSGNIDGVLDLVSPFTTNSLTIATNSNNNWDIDGANTGTATVGVNGRFSNMNIVTGGSGNDTFLIRLAGSISNKINGGAENNFDTVDLNEKTTVDINIANIVAGTSLYNGVERFVGNNDGTTPNTNISTITANNETNTWTISGINDGRVASPTLTIDFENFNNLSGGSQDDRFNFGPAGSINGIISGGSQVATFGDDVYMDANAIVDITLETTDDNTKLNLVGIERVTGNGTNSTLKGADEDNTWTITNENDGTVVNAVTGSINFIDFANLTGNSKKDDFKFNAGTSITGLIDGGANSPTRIDTVDMSLIGPDVVVTIGTDVVRIEKITGNNDDSDNTKSSTLRSGDLATLTEWDITGLNSGTVTYGVARDEMEFVNFNNIEGGTGDDTFTVSGGDIKGSITGGNGGGTDSVDYSANGKDITIGADTDGITQIERVIGNGLGSTIRGLATAAPTYTWTINDTFDDGVNDGRVVGGGENLLFIDFANIVGGNNIDTFEISGNSSVTGTISGSDGSDIIRLALTGFESGGFTFVGGLGNSDIINLNGGNANYDAVYTPNVSGFDQFTYSNTNTSYSIKYDVASTELIQNNLTANSLTVNGTSGNDAFVLDIDSFKVNTSKKVTFSYLDNANLIIDGLATGTDNVSIMDNIGSTGLNLTFSNVDVTGANNVVTAENLIFNNSGAGVSVSLPLFTDINVLSITDSNPIYINDAGNGADLDIAMLSTSNIVNVNLENGSILSSSNLASSAAFLATAKTGDIRLQGQNELSGPVSLLAANGTIRFDNNVATVLDNIDTNNFTLNILGGNNTTQTTTGLINANTLTLDSSGDFDLSNQNNILNNITVVNANSVEIANSQRSNIISVVANSVDMSSNGITLGTITADTISLDAGTAAISDNNGSLVANDINLMATNGIGTITNAINTQVDGGEISAVNKTGGDIVLSNVGNVLLRNISNLDGDGNIRIINNGDLTVDTLETITDFTDSGTGRIDINIVNGDVIGAKKANYTSQSDIRAHSVGFLLDSNHSVGNGARPISVEAPDTIEVLLARQTFIYFYGTEPLNFVGENELSNQIFDLISNLAGQQLIEVESLAQIDPAIFTDVRNYSHSDNALMMPFDQRYDDIEEEKEKRLQVN